MGIEELDGYTVSKKRYRFVEGRKRTVVLQWSLFLTNCYSFDRHGMRTDFKDHWTLWENADWKKIPNLRIEEQPK